MARRNPMIQPRGAAAPITDLLQRWHQGDTLALDQLVALVYDDLRNVARRQLKAEGEGHTLTPTAVVHEAYLRLATDQTVAWRNRTHFFAVAATCMRRILVDHARRRLAGKRGGGKVPESLDDPFVIPALPDERLVALDEALETLAQVEPRFARVVECRFFSGLTSEETAEALGVTDRTVRRDWVKARGWLEAWLGE